MELAKSFEPRAIEAKWYPFWEANGLFKPSLRDDVPAYCIQLPPPNVTGTLHMGHAFQHTLMDVLIRWHRMRGDNTLWQVGTDHAGIATQIVVENQLKAEGTSRMNWAVNDSSNGSGPGGAYRAATITNQMRRLGTSADWSRERFTMDEGLSHAVRETFVRLHEDGLIYRGKRLVNWDPTLGTAVSDLEVESEEENGTLWEIRYPLADQAGFITVATTRPETMLGDVAVAVNPDDPRYARLVGKQADLPLTGRRIPIIADASVDKAFGTGAVKITPGARLQRLRHRPATWPRAAGNLHARREAQRQRAASLSRSRPLCGAKGGASRPARRRSRRRPRSRTRWSSRAVAAPAKWSSPC